MRHLRVAVLDDYLGLASKHFAHFSAPSASTVARARADVTIFDDTLHSVDALAARLRPFEVVCTMRERTPFPAALLERLPNLRLLLCTGTQHSQFDIEAASARDIIVATATGRGVSPKTGTASSAATSAASSTSPGRDIRKGRSHPTTQHTWALLLSLVQNIAQDDANLKRSPPSQHSAAWQTTTTTRLEGKTLGICGLGRLGAATARLAVVGFGMKVLCWSTNLTQERADDAASSVNLPAYNKASGQPTFEVAASKREFFARADIVSVHYVLSPRSRGLIGQEELGWMKPTSFLVNTSRGPLVDEAALVDVLKRGAIAGAALDVFDVEPLPDDSPFRKSAAESWKSRLVITPHMGYVEDDIMNTWYQETAANVDNYLAGNEVADRLN